MQHFNIHLLWRPFTTPEKIFFFSLITALLPLAAVRCSIRKKNDDDALFLQTVKRICLCDANISTYRSFWAAKGRGSLNQTSCRTRLRGSNWEPGLCEVAEN